MTDFDFGFTSLSEEELTQSVTSKIDDRATRLYNMIIPLLDNLSKDADKDIIKWPNRLERINEFKKKLKQILDE